MEHLCNGNMLTFLQQALTFQDQFSICWCNGNLSESSVFSIRKEILVKCGCWPCQLSHELNVSLRIMYFSLPLKAKWLHWLYFFSLHFWMWIKAWNFGFSAHKRYEITKAQSNTHKHLISTLLPSPLSFWERGVDVGQFSVFEVDNTVFYRSLE